MASSPDNLSMALFCDFENVALGVRDANYERFDIKPILERLLLKGSIVVKKAYCDWERYKGFKATMHEANFELIEIPHVRQSGKNSADIRLVVDALDLCYTKAHVNTFVIISGDSDFSPLVSKLRENAKLVIGVGVKQSTSDLLIANCDEFIFYDELVRESQRVAARREPREAQASRRSPDEEKRRKDELEARRSQAMELAVGTFDALLSERGESGKIWASVLKEAIKRRKPDFSEANFGFRTFGNLLEEAQARGLLEFGRDDKSGAYVFRSGSDKAPTAEVPPEHAPALHAAMPTEHSHRHGTDEMPTEHSRRHGTDESGTAEQHRDAAASERSASRRRGGRTSRKPAPVLPDGAALPAGSTEPSGELPPAASPQAEPAAPDLAAAPRQDLEPQPVPLPEPVAASAPTEASGTTESAATPRARTAARKRVRPGTPRSSRSRKAPDPSADNPEPPQPIPSK